MEGAIKGLLETKKGELHFMNSQLENLNRQKVITASSKSPSLPQDDNEGKFVMETRSYGTKSELENDEAALSDVCGLLET
jgi:hypothetical protein